MWLSRALVPAVVAVAVAAALAGGRRDADRLLVFAAESPAGVELRIFVPTGVDPGSVQVELSGRRIVVVARDASGRRLRSHPLEVEKPVVEEGASAAWEEEGWLTITLRGK